MFLNKRFLTDFKFSKKIFTNFKKGKILHTIPDSPESAAPLKASPCKIPSVTSGLLDIRLMVTLLRPRVTTGSNIVPVVYLRKCI